MMHFFPDGDGGFFGYDDPVLDLEGGAVLILVAAVSIAAIVVPFASEPGMFADGIVCILVGLLLVGLSFGRGGLPFLRPLALPFFVYALASSTYAFIAFSGEFGLLMWPILGFYLIFAGLGLFGMLLGGEEEGVITLFTLGFGAAIWLTALLAGMDDYESWLYGTFMFYLLRVALVIGLVWAAVVFVMWIIAIFKGEVDFKAIGFTLIAIALGCIPLFAGGIIGNLFPDGPISLVGLALLLAVFAATGWVARRVSLAMGVEASVFPLLVVLIVVGATGFMMIADYRASAEFLVGLRPLANSTFLVNEGLAASQLAANALGSVCSGVVWVFTSIFDLSSVTIEAPMHIGYSALAFGAAAASAVGLELGTKKIGSGGF